MKALPWAAGMILLGSGCGLPEGDYFGKVADHPDPTHLRWCNFGEPQYLDPALTTSTTGLPLVYALWDGLTRHNLQGLPEPSIATHWDISEDLRTFTFHLRDDARWSNGRPLTAHDFAYQIVRVLHPFTASRNVDALWKLKNAQAFTGNRIRVMLRDVGPFKKGDVVEIVAPAEDASEEAKALASTELSYSNTRVLQEPAALRDFPGFWDFCGQRDDCRLKEPYRTVPAGESVTIIDLKTDASGGEWGYIHWLEGQGVYGWVPTTQLKNQPHADFEHTVTAVPPSRIPGRMLAATDVQAEGTPPLITGKVKAADVMMLPEALGMRVVDDQTLVLETENPIPYMIDLSVQRAFRPSPREAVSRWPQKWSEPAHVITSGPYHLAKWLVRDRIEMTKSPTYWDAEHTRLGRITVFSMDDQAASTNYYYQGGCDALVQNNIPPSYLPVLRGEQRGGRPYKDYKVAPYLGVYLYLINTERFPNVHFRRALSMAIDRAPIPKIANGGQIPTVQLMPGTPIDQLSPEDRKLCGVSEDQPGVASVMISGELCYVPPPGLPYDLEAAKQELALARKEMGAAFPKSFSLKFNIGSEQHKLLAEYMQYEWKTKLGLDVQLESQEWKTFLSDTTYGQYDVARMGWIMNFPDLEAEMLPQFRCDSPDNRTKWCSREFEEIYERAEATTDRTERVRIIREAERVFLEEAPVIPVYVYTQHHLQKPYVKDLAINLTNMIPFEKAWIDPQWKQHAAASEAERN